MCDHKSNLSHDKEAKYPQNRIAYGDLAKVYRVGYTSRDSFYPGSKQERGF